MYNIYTQATTFFSNDQSIISEISEDRNLQDEIHQIFARQNESKIAQEVDTISKFDQGYSIYEFNSIYSVGE